MSSLIANSKVGDCNRCPVRNTQVRKRGKELVCLSCCRTEDVAKQMEKIKLKATLSKLGRYQKEVGVPRGTSELQRWFEDRHKEMKGICQHCNGKTEKNRTTYKCSIAHILPKAYFKSVATHPLNWVELCFYGKSCHTNLDQMSLDLIELNCFDEVVTKFVSMYPDIAPDERRRIPAILLEYLKTEI